MGVWFASFVSFGLHLHVNFLLLAFAKERAEMLYVTLAFGSMQSPHCADAFWTCKSKCILRKTKLKHLASSLGAGGIR